MRGAAKSNEFKIEGDKVEEEKKDLLEKPKPDAPVTMSPIGHTLIYPRKDN